MLQRFVGLWLDAQCGVWMPETCRKGIDKLSVYDSSANLFSSNALTFTVLPSSPGTTHVTPINLTGLGMAWDNASQLLYVGVADYDGQYPNSIVAVNPSTGAVVKTAQIGSDPMYLSDGANGQYLYVAYASTTNMTQVALPSLIPTATAKLADAVGNVWFPGYFDRTRLHTGNAWRNSSLRCRLEQRTSM